jgi:hypothetical protein
MNEADEPNEAENLLNLIACDMAIGQQISVADARARIDAVIRQAIDENLLREKRAFCAEDDRDG